MKKKLLVFALLIGIGWDILFWQQSPGINFPILIAGCLAAGIFVLQTEKVAFDKKGIWLIVPLVIFAAMAAIRRDGLVMFLNVTLALFFSFLLSATYQSGLWLSFNFVDYLVQSARSIGGIFSRPFQILGGKSEPNRKREIWAVLRGLLLALPVLIVFSVLLSSADEIFAQRLEGIFSFLQFENLGTLISRIVGILAAAFFFTGIIGYAASKSDGRKLTGLEKPVIPPFLGFTEGTIILACVVLLFAGFVCIQFRYFFSGQANIHIDGFTYAEYARRGFGELVAVAIFSLLLLQSLRTVVKMTGDKEKKAFRFLSAGLAGLVLIILLSAFQRLSLYESAYGFSKLRTYAHIFMVWLGILLFGTALLPFIHKTRWFANMMIACAVGFAISLNMLNVDAFIAKQNITQAITDGPLDGSYLASLTYDAVPTLVRAYNSTEITAQTREQVGGALACQVWRMKESSTVRANWQSFHLSDWRAKQALQTIADDLSGYRIQDDHTNCEMTSPSGETIHCCSSPIWD